MYITVVKTLCAFISTNVEDFNVINVTTFFHKLFEVPSTLVDKEHCQQTTRRETEVTPVHTNDTVTVSRCTRSAP